MKAGGTTLSAEAHLDGQSEGGTMTERDTKLAVLELAIDLLADSRTTPGLVLYEAQVRLARQVVPWVGTLTPANAMVVLSGDESNLHGSLPHRVTTDQRLARLRTLLVTLREEP